MFKMSNSVSRSYSKNNQDNSLREETSCLRPPETAKPALVAVDGDIHSYLEALKSIADQLALLNKCAFDNSILSDEEHYALLEIELQTQQLITGEPIICSEVA